MALSSQMTVNFLKNEGSGFLKKKLSWLLGLRLFSIEMNLFNH